MQIYAIDEFRKEVARETGLGFVELPNGTSWANLEVDETCIKEQEEKLDSESSRYRHTTDFTTAEEIYYRSNEISSIRLR